VGADPSGKKRLRYGGELRRAGGPFGGGHVEAVQVRGANLLAVPPQDVREDGLSVGP
jgi:hypothetical protein